MLDSNCCWEALGKRDRSLDGTFFFGVLTTGVYCRPSCPARRPRRENVRFYATPADAERAGLRACLRCRPKEAYSALTDVKMLELCDYIERHAGERITLADLAARAELSRFHLLRRFKEVVGLTPKAYMEACRLRRFKQNLRRGGGVTEAIYEAGFGSSRGAYERAGKDLGMTPGEYRRGGGGRTIAYARVNSPAGPMLVGATERGICFVGFGDDPGETLEALRLEYPAAELKPAAEPRTPELDAWLDAIRAQFSGEKPRLELPVDVRATAFQMRVWQYLQSIPFGEVRSYSQVATAIGQPTAVRAVAHACASNKLAVVIPCHRVVRGTGALGGYKWGLERKRALLKMESGAHELR